MRMKMEEAPLGWLRSVLYVEFEDGHYGSPVYKVYQGLSQNKGSSLYYFKNYLLSNNNQVDV